MPAQVRPKVFVGSSSEARDIVSQLLASIGHCAIAEPWWAAPAFTLENTTIEGLLTAIMSYDHAIFLMSGDDLTTSRNATLLTARDNVLFEMGLFIGQLGRERVTVIVQQAKDGPELKIPSDLAGVTMPRIKSTSETMVAEVERIAPKLCARIRNANLRHFAFTLTKSWDFDRATHEFILDIDRNRLHRNRLSIGNRPLALAIRKRGGRQGFEQSPIVIGSVRSITAVEADISSDEISLYAGSEGCLGDLTHSDIVEAYLLLVPEDLDEAEVRKSKTLAELFAQGCRIIDVPGCDVGE
jgi:hypothetical protein